MESEWRAPALGICDGAAEAGAANVQPWVLCPTENSDVPEGLEIRIGVSTDEA